MIQAEPDAAGANLQPGGEDVAGHSVVGGDEPDGAAAAVCWWNGKETVWPSDKGEQRPVTSVL